VEVKADRSCSVRQAILHKVADLRRDGQLRVFFRSRAGY